MGDCPHTDHVNQMIGHGMKKEWAPTMRIIRRKDFSCVELVAIFFLIVYNHISLSLLFPDYRGHQHTFIFNSKEISNTFEKVLTNYTTK